MAEAFKLPPGDSEKRRATWYAYAREVMAGLDSFVLPAFPARPEGVPDQDLNCYRTMRSARRKGAKAETIEIARDTRAWLDAVWLREEQARGTLACLLRAQRAIEQIGDHDLDAERAKLRQHIEREFDLSVAVVPDGLAFQQIISKWRPNPPLCSRWLLEGRPPKEFIP